MYFLVDHWRSICSTNASSGRRELDWRAKMVGIFPNTDSPLAFASYRGKMHCA
jgi:transposase-like protein